MNCLTGQGEESRLSSAEMEQLIQNVRPVGQGWGTSQSQAQSSPLAFPHRSWRSLTSTGTAPSTSLNSSTLSLAPRTLPGVVSPEPGWGFITLIAQLALGQSWWWQRAGLPCAKPALMAEGTASQAGSVSRAGSTKPLLRGDSGPCSAGCL